MPADREGPTARVALRPVTLDDAPRVQELFPHWEIVRYMRSIVPWPYPADGAEHYLREVALPQMERGEAWHFALCLCADPEAAEHEATRPDATQPEVLIGCLSLLRGQQDNRGFWLGLPWHAHGLMSEACRWANDYWFETLGFGVLRVAKASANEASRRISQKQGMRLVGHCEREYVAGRLPSEQWEITREERRAWKAGSLSRTL
jgi:RimJ/RimL family protein N-acetyltransferase